MSDARFDISFSGTLKPDADPAWTREQLRVLFKLDDKGLDRLFSGTPTLIKRNVDSDTADRYRRVFDETGAIVDVLPAGEPKRSKADAGGSGQGAEPTAADAVKDTSGLSLAPMGGFLEEPPEVKIMELDISHLSLVPGPEWTLEDCEPAPPNIDPPDTSHLTLAEMESPPDDESR
ncbi:hypothetical protein G3480_18385 [Thiorhodococcus mannitoliphagus]|uniref:Uncharacterized protein n=1 Tax=Thiorhodococcus mannitoliphagus TaxID=329406 RepID=A0A6P1DX37_9GAMM|nr:hypothetical protein [Thiorhodococcus mannitoliphagus]NEX22249.1 hypothetical protein [Thiorhodococcus mannitoliphagus]